MNVWLIAEDERLERELEQCGEIASLTPLHSAAEAEQRANASGGAAGEQGPELLLASDRVCDLREAVQLRERFAAARMYYMASNRDDAVALQRVRSVCAAHGIVCIPPYRTVSQICAELLRPEGAAGFGPSKVIACVSALPQSGLTVTVLLVALRLAELTGIRIGVLGLNGWNPGNTALPYAGRYADELWGSLQGNRLTPEELEARMHRAGPNVHYLAGNRDWKKLYYYGTEGARQLLQLARQRFELVLADAGCYLDHALAAQAVIDSDLLLLQTDQSLQAREQWDRTRSQIVEPVLGYDPERILLWFNRMQESAELETAKQLARQYGLPYIGSLPYVPQLRTAETERRSITVRTPELMRELDKICRALIRYYSLPEAVQKSAGWAEGSAWSRWLQRVQGAGSR